MKSIKVQNIKSSKAVRSQLQYDIVKGRIAPNERMPNRNILEKRFGVSSVTVQSAMDGLIEDGFIQATPGRGTFVSPYPPHLCQYGLLFQMSDPRTYASPSSHFYQRACEAMDKYQKENDNVRFCIYTNLTSHDGEEYDRLVDDISKHKLAGLFFVFLNPNFFVNTPIIDEPGISRVAYWRKTEIPGVSSIQEDNFAIVTKGLDYLASRGRKRVAYLFGDGDYVTIGRCAEVEAAKRGMVCRPHWLLNPSSDQDLGWRGVSLLMQGAPDDRPDGIICTSQNLTDIIVAGLFAANIHVPRDVEIVTNCLFPSSQNSLVPMKRLGFNIYDYVEMFLHLSAEQAKGNFSPLAIIDPKFEEEENEFNHGEISG